MVQVDFPAYVLCIYKQNALRITKGNISNRNGLSPIFSIINGHLVDINMFAKFYEIPSLPFQDIEKPKRRGWTDGQRENSIFPPTHKHSLRGEYKNRVGSKILGYNVGLHEMHMFSFGLILLFLLVVTVLCSYIIIILHG